MTLLDVLAHAMDGRERGLAILAAERSLARVLEEVSDERVFVPELDAANVARKEFLAFVNLEKLDRFRRHEKYSLCRNTATFWYEICSHLRQGVLQ